MTCIVKPSLALIPRWILNRGKKKNLLGVVLFLFKKYKLNHTEIWTMSFFFISVGWSHAVNISNLIKRCLFFCLFFLSNNLFYDFQQSNTTKNINNSNSLTSPWSTEVLCTEDISMQLQQASLVCHLPWQIDAKMLLL